MAAVKQAWVCAAARGTYLEDFARVTFRNYFHPLNWNYDVGFRVALLPSG